MSGSKSSTCDERGGKMIWEVKTESSDNNNSKILNRVNTAIIIRLLSIFVLY